MNHSPSMSFTRLSGIIRPLSHAPVPFVLGLTLAFWVSLVVPQTVHGQPQISIQPLVQLGGSDSDQAMLVFNSRVAEDGQGRFFVSPIGEPGGIGVFSPAGTLLEVFGRDGDG